MDSDRNTPKKIEKKMIEFIKTDPAFLDPYLILFELYQKVGAETQLIQKVLDTTEEGLLYHPETTGPEAGYILLPRGDTYDQIRALFANSLNP